VFGCQKSNSPPDKIIIKLIIPRIAKPKSIFDGYFFWIYNERIVIKNRKKHAEINPNQKPEVENIFAPPNKFA